MDVLEVIISSFLVLITTYLLFNVVYILFFALAGHKKIPKSTKIEPDVLRKFCVLIPAYKEDLVIIETANSAINHNYSGQFDVFVIADKLKPETIVKLTEQGVRVVEVQFEKSTKGKALQSAMNRLPESTYDIALILDADNIMESNFINKVNIAFDEGAKAVQGHRTAKNLDTPFAILDACNEEINNHIFRKGHYAVGLGAALIGSGMAFKFDYLKSLLIGIENVLAEDREMEIRIGKDRVKTRYLDDAYVYDEKVNNAEVFTKQRSRWIFSQLECFKLNFYQGILQLFKHRNISLFDKLMQTILLPRILLMGILSLMLIFSILLPYGYSSYFWIAVLLLASSALLISLPKKLYNAALWKAIIRLPLIFFLMCIGLINIRKLNGLWVHTPHTHASKNSEN